MAPTRFSLYPSSSYPTPTPTLTPTPTPQTYLSPPPRFAMPFLSAMGATKQFPDNMLNYRDVPAGAFAECQKPSLLQGWGESLTRFKDWVFGTGPLFESFDTCSLQSQNMATAPDVMAARDLMYRKNLNTPYESWEPVTNFKGKFGLSGFLDAGIDPTEQFVGSYSVEIFPQADKQLRFELSNTTSLESFLYGLGPEYERSTLPFGGNMRQVYTWTEPVILP